MANPERSLLWALAILTVSAVLAYSNTFSVPFLFDDSINILENPSIRKLWPSWAPMQVPAFTGILGRPVINFSLALNYFISGDQVWSYHVFNLLVHILSAWTLLALIRRTVAFMPGDSPHVRIAFRYAFSCALLWTLHPLATQAVTYIIQRCESLMALFVLLTIYSAVRYWQNGSGKHWQYLAVLFFFLAVGSKESAAVTPVLIIIYEWIFRGQTPLKAFKASPFLYAGLLLGIMVTVMTTLLNDTLALRAANISFPILNYWITQADVMIHYIRLAIWPTGQVIDYGWPASTFGDSWPSVLLVLMVLGLTLRRVLRKNASGFLLACFFLFLAPSSLIPLPDIAFEHRMYLPLAAVICLVIDLLCNGLAWGGALQIQGATCRWIFSPKSLIPITICLSLLLGCLTYQRNYVYRSEMSIWSDTIKKRPGNFRGYHGVGLALSKEGRFDQGLDYLKRALMLNDRNAYVHNDIGFLLFRLHRADEAIPYFTEAIRLKPNNFKAYNNLGAALGQTGRLQEAIHYFMEAIKLNPDYMPARNNLQVAIAQLKETSSD
jgi:tetratricopeptide (TPR) repeat protein